MTAAEERIAIMEVERVPADIIKQVVDKYYDAATGELKA